MFFPNYRNLSLFLGLLFQSSIAQVIKLLSNENWSYFPRANNSQFYTSSYQNSAFKSESRVGIAMYEHIYQYTGALKKKSVPEVETGCWPKTWNGSNSISKFINQCGRPQMYAFYELPAECDT